MEEMELELSKEKPPVTNKNVVFGNPVNPEDRVLTGNAKWLRLDKVFEKFHRPHIYDIGGTYVTDSVSDYWFLFKTEQVHNVFLLHLFIISKQESSCTISLSCCNELKFDKKSEAVFLKSTFKPFNFKTEMNIPNYLTTYSFTDLDVELLKDKSLYIAVSFSSENVTSTTQLKKLKLNHDFGALLADPICSDFTIESVDGDKFKVHKVILSANSDVFKAMLKEDTAENQNSYVKLVNVGSDDLKYLLEFIYSGIIKDVDHCNFYNLLALADQYNVKGLSELSQHALSMQINGENVLEILVLADMYNSDSLKIAAKKYIKLNPKVIQSSTFKEIKNVELVQELCNYLLPI